MKWKILALTLGTALSVSAQAQATPQTTRTIDETQLVTLRGTVHPLARPEYDRGRVSDALPMGRLLLSMARPADRERDLQQFLEDAHSPGSANYHKWLTPEEYGARFGAADEDTEVVSGWLQSHGFSVAHIAKNKLVVEFSGTAGQIREALHTEIHQYSVKGVTFYANAGGIAVPRAIASRIGGFAPINSFPVESYLRLVGSGTMNPASHRVAPRFTLSQNSKSFYAFGPADFATQYDVAPVYAAGINGAGQTIGIIGDGNINLALVDAYRTLFNLPADHTQMIIDGQDPGDGLGPNIEGYLDAEVSGAVAPGATVNFYIAGGNPFEDPLALAALRAVEDNQASVLSVSYGECEQLLGEAGNQLWAGLWEQAAAQGQTVFVSSGDSGPTACPLGVGLANGTIEFTDDLSVSGIGSTPWNVSVGGTDFYYADYANGSPSAATLWNQFNNGSNGSLRASLPEQVWDDAFGLNAISYWSLGGFDIPSAAGGGGASNCSQTTIPAAGSVPTCIAGYAKPAWQNAPGVPNDQARDLPDVSLFAAEGMNLSAAPICAEPGDCAPVTSGDPQITLVGGTSVSSPSMAGVMALINQKYGRQGQANYTLYALARQYPVAFHDITLGTNDSLCEPGTASDCNAPVASQWFVDSYGKYAAGPDYDLATGLGSIDVNQMLSDWTRIVYVPTATTLRASPASVVHGSAVAINVAVAASSGSAVPTGNVSLSAGSGIAIPANTPMMLANGSASASLTNLPGGSYELTAQYAGDGSFASSSSTPVELTVTPEASSTALNLQYVSGAANGSNVLPTGTIQNGGQAPFGSMWIFQATPSGVTKQGLATGTATFSDGGNSVVVPLGGKGTAVWLPPNLAIGAHSIAASYSGDASYAASSAGPVAFAVVKGTPALSAAPEVFPVGFSSSGEVYQAGTTLVVHVLMGQNGVATAVAPTGTVTVNFGTMKQTVALTPDSYLNEALSTAFVTLTNVPAGTYQLSASYSGDSNWNPTSYVYPDAMVYQATTASPTSTTLNLTPANVSSSGSVTFTVGVQATSTLFGAPAGLVLLYANGTLFGSLVVESVSRFSSSGSMTVPASVIPYGTLQVVAEYMGGFDMDPSVSYAVPLTVTATDFSLSIAGRNLSIAPSQSASVPVSLGGPASASITVALSCRSSSAQIGCTVTPNSASVTGSGSASLTINAFTLSSAASIPESPARDRRMGASGGAMAAGLIFLLVLPNRKRARMPVLLLAFIAALAMSSGCGGGGSSSAPPGSQIIAAPAGSYSIVVTGVSAGITHNATVNVSVQ